MIIILRKRIMKNNFILAFLFAFFLCFLLFSCKKADNNPVNPEDNKPIPLKFLSCVPNHGQPGSIVQIIGQGFNYKKDYITVKFGGINAEILEIVDTVIKVLVPNISFGLNPISIIRDTESVECKDCFLVVNPADTLPTPLQLISCSPTHGQQGSIVQIAGKGFNYHKDMIEVYFGGIIAKILNILDTLISVRVLNSPLGTISISINRDTEMVECKNCFMMTNSDFYFSKAVVTLTNIQGKVVESSYTGNPGNYHYADTSYLTNNYAVNLTIKGDYINFNKPFHSVFSGNSISIVDWNYETISYSGGKITTDNHAIFIIDTINKTLNEFEASNDYEGSSNGESVSNIETLKLNNLPYTISKDGDLLISIEGLKIKDYFISHLLSKSTNQKFNGNSYGLKNFTIQNNSVLTITIYH
jgi:hypothetical protein